MSTSPTPTASTILAQAGRNTNAFVQNMVDVEPKQWWDSVLQYPTVLGTASNTQLSAQYFCFSIPIGTPNPNLPGGVANTKQQTNMTLPNQFSPPDCLLLMAIQFQYSSRMILSDIQLVENNSYFEFKIKDKIFHEGWLRDYPAGGGLMGVSTNNGEEVWTNGFATPLATRRFQDWSKYIPPLTRFTLNIFFNGSTSGGAAPILTGPYGLEMRVVLDGLTSLAVQ